MLEDEQPFQSQSDFGQPELVVYDNPRFYIQVLFWLEGTTEIHQHEFSGAFHLLEGSSLHTQFAFDDAQPVSAHMRVGRLRVKEARLLETGCTVPIISGGAYVHSLFHLDTPSLSVVVRTHSDPGTGPQFTYLPPHLAVDPFFNDALTARRRQLLDVLEKLEDPSYPDLLLEMLASLDFERGFYVLQNGMRYLRHLGKWEEAWEVFEKKHPSLSKYAAPTLDEIEWRDGIIGFRSSVTNVEHRFFLALLLNVQSRADILGLVAQRFPGAAVETILRWAEELSNVSKVETWILDAEFPPEIAVANGKRLELFLAALRHFLEGAEASAPVRKLSSSDLALIRASLADQA